MSEGTSDKLLRMVEPFLIRKNTNMRERLTYIFSSLSKAIFLFVLFKYIGLVGFHSSGKAPYVSMKFRRTSPSSAFTSPVGEFSDGELAFTVHA
jgi:hypothetical protein